MGHYDDCYESTRQDDEKRRRENLLRWIPEKIDKMKSHELEVMYEVAQHVEDYYGLLKIMKRGY